MTAFVRMAKIDDRPIVRGQINDYLGELSALVSGKKTYPYFDDYWRDPTRLPYLVEVASEPIGFIFVNRWSPSGRGTDYSVAEFYVRPEWRRHGHGLCAASQVLKKHPGQWELSFSNVNVKAKAFWFAVVAKIGATSCEVIHGPDMTILRFITDAP
jgi:predicted acetyltransferase